MEFIERNGLRKHIYEKGIYIRNNHSFTELSKTQFFPVSIAKNNRTKRHFQTIRFSLKDGYPCIDEFFKISSIVKVFNILL